ncbi:MAG: hypothetical protein IJS40_08610 [Synergistaceae bacterium]|nr:hypothetical protein [Synergistaceae bacterium]
MKRGRKVNTFTVEYVLELYARATNDDQRVEILDKLTKPRLLELAEVKGLKLKNDTKKLIIINRLIDEFKREAEQAEEPEEPKQAISDEKLADMPLKQLRQLAGLSLQQLANAINYCKATCYKAEFYGEDTFGVKKRMREYLINYIKGRCG